LNAFARKVYAEKAEALLKANPAQHTSIMQGSPVYITLKKNAEAYRPAESY